MTSKESLDAYVDVRGEVEASQVTVILKCLDEATASMTSQEIAAVTDLTNHAVTRRRGMMKRRGLITEDAPRLCSISGRRVKPIMVTPAGLSVLAGGDLPAMRPGQREHEVAVLKAARLLVRAWEAKDETSIECGEYRLITAVGDLDGPKAPPAKVPWGAKRREDAARDGVWIRQSGDALPIALMEGYHLSGAVKWCRRHGARPGHPVLDALLREQERRGVVEREREARA